METTTIIKHCVFIGILTIIIGIITEKTLYKFNRRNNILSRLKHNYFLFVLSLFIFGMFIQFLFEYSGFETYCYRKCDETHCEYICQMKINVD